MSTTIFIERDGNKTSCVIPDGAERVIRLYQNHSGNVLYAIATPIGNGHRIRVVQVGQSFPEPQYRNLKPWDGTMIGKNTQYVPRDLPFGFGLSAQWTRD